MHLLEPIVYANTWIQHRNRNRGLDFRLLLVGFDDVLLGEMTYIRIAAKASNHERFPHHLVGCGVDIHFW